MPMLLLAGPAIEPWTVADLKSFLRVEHDADDAVIASLLTAARAQIEAATGRMLLAQRWRLVRDAWPRDGRIVLRGGPLRALIAVRSYDERGYAHGLDLDSFVLDLAGDVIASPPWALPEPGRDVAGIELDLELGYGTTPDDVPPPLRHAVRTLVAQWYDNRGDAASGAGTAVLPGGIAAMIAGYRTVTL
uniref:PhiE125 gp8 family phage protein n=1 Tax=Rhodopseudomonas palustris (strain DX-1) TaxID=652103 RepID=E6VEP0_RHOPX